MTAATSRSPAADIAGRIGRRLRLQGERVRYRLGLDGPDPGRVRLAPEFRHPVDASRRESLTARYRALFPLAAEAELAEAGRLAGHRFSFLGHEWEEGERIAWSRDPVSGREWSRGFSPGIPYRGAGRLGDIKLPWELSKHQYFFTLGKSSWLSGDPDLAREIVRQITSWMEENPWLRGIHWTSALEAGTRAVSWILAHPFIASEGDEGFREAFIRSLAQHFIFVERNLSRGRYTNTHLAGEAVALVAGGLFLDGPRSRRWLATGLEILGEEMERQVTADGVHAERSVAYHRFFLDNYHLAGALLAANGRTLPAAVLGGMERMTAFLRDVLFPDGSAPAFGDNDDARALWFHASCPSDYRSLLALGAVLFRRGDFKGPAGGPTEELLWLLGEEGVDAFEALAAEDPEHTSVAYPEGGYYVLRGGWSAGDPVLVFDCGPLGHGPAGHGHADALSFQLFAEGYAYLVDPGTYSYNLDYGWRDAFRSTRAHNTVVVDGRGQSEPADRMSWATRASARCNRWLTTPWFDVVEGEHDGYLRLPSPVAHRRIVVFLKSGAWVVWDHLAGAGDHRFEANLHLQPGCAVVREEQEGSLGLSAPGCSTLRLGWHGNPPHGVGTEVLREGEHGGFGFFSPRYGVREPSSAIRALGEFRDSTSFGTTAAVPGLGIEAGAGEGFLAIEARDAGGGRETVLVRLAPGGSYRAAGLAFEGDVLYRCARPGTAPLLWGQGCTSLQCEGTLELRSPTPLVSLELRDGRCELVPAGEDIEVPTVGAGEGIEVVVGDRRGRAAGRPSASGGRNT